MSVESVAYVHAKSNATTAMPAFMGSWSSDHPYHLQGQPCPIFGTPAGPSAATSAAVATPPLANRVIILFTSVRT